MHTEGVEVVATDAFEDWYMALRSDDREAVALAVKVLKGAGVTLGYPRSSALHGSPRYAFRELRVQSRGHPFRVIYAFDARRRAVLIIGGDKTGDDRFYRAIIPRAEKLWEQYLSEQA